MIIGVCGYGFTGSGAVFDLLKEYSEINSVATKGVFEFTIPYSPSGLINLEYYLTKAPSKHVNGDNAIYRFISMSNNLSRSMNRVTNGEFASITDRYIRSLVQVEYSCHIIRGTPNKFKLFLERFLTKIQRRIEKRRKKYFPLLRENKRYIAIYPDDFLLKTKKYVDEILNAAGLIKESQITLLDQPFPPNDPSLVFHYFDDPFAIVVNRDPRDLYVLVKHLRFSSAKFVPHDSVEDFVKYYRAVSSFNPDEDKKRILRIRFEDLIYEYDRTVKKIENFVGVTKHAFPKKFFNPEISKKNTFMMDLFPEDKEEIAYIEKELKDYLFPFEKYEKVSDRSGIYGSLSADKHRSKNK